MKSVEEITGAFWHSVAAEIHHAMSERWLPVAGIAKLSGVPIKQVESMLSGVPSKREPKVSDIIAVMAALGFAPEIDTYRIDPIGNDIGSQPSNQLSILDVLGQGWNPEGDE